MRLAAGASMVLLAGWLAGGCGIDERSDAYLCDLPSDCPSGRTCSQGYCVVGSASGSTSSTSASSTSTSSGGTSTSTSSGGTSSSSGGTTTSSSTSTSTSGGPTTLRLEAEDLNLNRYDPTSQCACTGPSAGQCVRSQGGGSQPSRATVDAFPGADASYDLTIRFCDEDDDDPTIDSYQLLVNGAPAGQWTSEIGGTMAWNDFQTTVDLQTDDRLAVSCDRGSTNTFCRIDYLEFVPN